VAATPPAVVLLATVIVAWAEAIKLKYPGLIGFAELGTRYSRRVGLPGTALSPFGYDGQYNYYLARDPGLVVRCAQTWAGCPFDALRDVRMERILYPVTARLLALGQPALIPAALLLVNLLAIAGIVVLVGKLCCDAGASRWLGAAGLYCGVILPFEIDLADPFAVFWVVLAVYLLRKRHPLWAAAAVAAALLTREQLLLYLPFLALPLLAQRRWRTLAASAAIALAPFAAWQLVLRALYGHWALLAGDTSAAGLVPIPFGGLWAMRSAHDFPLLVLTVAAPMVAAGVITVLALRGDGLRGPLRDPAPLMVLAYLALLSFTAPIQWADVWATPRLAAPAIVLAVVVSVRVNRPLRLGYAALLAATTLLPFVRDVGVVLHALVA